MRRRTLLTAAAGLFLPAFPVLAAEPTTAVRLETGAGVVVVELATAAAPLTTANFLRYVDGKRLDGAASFYRATGSPAAGLIEGGLQNDPARLLPPIAHEPTSQTGLSHRDGTLSMARNAPGTATCDFFICLGAAGYLDAHPGAAGDDAGYAAFGQVTQGMEVVKAILALPTSQEARNPVMRGQMLQAPVPILRAARIPA